MGEPNQRNIEIGAAIAILGHLGRMQAEDARHVATMSTLKDELERLRLQAGLAADESFDEAGLIQKLPSVAQFEASA